MVITNIEMTTQDITHTHTHTHTHTLSGKQL